MMASDREGRSINQWLT